MPVSDDSSSAFDLICAEIERQLRGGELLMDAAAASELLLTVRYQLDTQPRPLVIVHGPLFQAVKAARAQVYGRLIQLRHARCEVLDERWQLRPTGQRDVRALLIDVLSVLLAAITAAGVERAYACAERRAMAAAVVAKNYRDALGVELQCNSVCRAAAEAIHALAHRTGATEDADCLPPVDVIHADVTRRMHGEVATDVVAAGELVIAARHLLDPMPRGELSYGPLHEGGNAARKSVYRRLVQLWQARRAVTDGDVDLRDARTLLTDLDSILREMRTAATIQQSGTAGDGGGGRRQDSRRRNGPRRPARRGTSRGRRCAPRVAIGWHTPIGDPLAVEGVEEIGASLPGRESTPSDDGGSLHPSGRPRRVHRRRWCGLGLC